MSKVCIKRAVRTFFQTAVGYISVNIVAGDFTSKEAAKNALIGLGVCAVAAGISAVMNMKECDK
ncbi:MAG: hypothetical protein DBY14_04540 [Escherichia coli]|nr:MAG: hypothetical protein DBY14_04540 [Escherichia coli]